MRRITRLKRWLAGTALFFVLFVFTQPVSAVVYKWKDDKGNSYFTDDLNKIPLPHRSKSTVEIMRGTAEPPPSTPSESGEAPADETKVKKTGEAVALAKALADKQAAAKKKLAAEKPGLQSAIAHLESEIKRDERLLTTIPPTVLNGKYFVAGIQQLLPAKKALAEKIDKSELPILVTTREFLVASIAQDEREKVSEEQAMLNQAALLFDRLKAELPTISQLVEQLKSELGRVEQALAVPEPLIPVVELPKGKPPEAKPAEPAVNGEKPPLGNETGGMIKSERLEK